MRTGISLFLKAVVVCFAAAGTLLSLTAGGDSFMGGTRVLMYFTIQSNIALAVICLLGAYFMISGRKAPGGWHTIKYVGTVSITLTGMVFCFVLAPTMGAMAWNKVNVFTHVIVPIAAVLDFFVACLDVQIAKQKVLYVALPPIVYAVYAGIGYVRGWEFAPGANYPYFFLNWGSPAGAFGITNELPFLGCMWWILILLLFLILVGMLYLWILDMLRKIYR